MPPRAPAAPARRRAGGCVLLLPGLGAAGPARGQPDAPASSTRPLLRVITGYAAPFVQLPGTPVSGFSVEVWRGCRCWRLGLKAQRKAVARCAANCRGAVAAGFEEVESGRCGDRLQLGVALPSAMCTVLLTAKLDRRPATLTSCLARLGEGRRRVRCRQYAARQSPC